MGGRIGGPEPSFSAGSVQLERCFLLKVLGGEPRHPIRSDASAVEASSIEGRR